MMLLLDLAIRTSAPVVAALAACMLLRRRSAALRHRVLTVAVIAVVAVGPLSVVLPSWDVPLPGASVPSVDSPMPAASPREAAGAAPPGAPASRRAQGRQMVSLVWIMGFALATALLLLRVARLVRLTRRAAAVADGPWRRMTTEIAAQYRIGRPIALLTTPAPETLATWGVLGPRVLLPAQALHWSDERVRAAHANPVYPSAMRDAGLEGVVPVEALIGADGTVASVRVLSAQVHPEFARAAASAVRQWVFSPTLLNGVPVEVQMTVSVRFRLED